MISGCVIDFHITLAGSGILMGKGDLVYVMYEAHGVSPGVSKEIAEESERMARLFSVEVLYKETEPLGSGNTFRGACVKHGIPAICPELDGQSTFIESVVKLTVRGLKDIMVDLGMIEGKIELPAKQYILKWVADPSDIVTNNNGGVLIPSAKLGPTAVTNNKGGVFIPSAKVGDIVKKGDKVGIIYSPRTLEVIETLTAHRDGYVLSIPENPVKSAEEKVMEIVEILEVLEN